MTVFFTSDLHLGHNNIIEYSNRPFRDVEHMNETLVQNWNDRVQPGDQVYCLGDFFLGRDFDEGEVATKFAKRLNGQKFFIWGNHDKRIRKSKSFCDQWIWCRDLTQIEVNDPDGKQKITLCHFAMRTWNQSHRGAWQLYGHSHNSLPDDPNALNLDVGVDCWDYAPVSYEEIKQRMSRKTWKAIDHHKERDL